MKKLLYTLALIVTITNCLAQSNQPTTKELIIGDKMPEIQFQMMNYKSSTAKLSDFKGKLVILDFWATWCGSCVAHFPENERLQKEFGDKIQILLVNTKNTRDKESTIHQFLEKQKAIKDKNVTLPIVFNDSLLDHYFPHKFIPHYAWVNQDGKVIAITASNDVNSKNIKRFLSGEKLITQLKEDALMYDFSKSYLMNDDGRTKGIKAVSIFTNELKLDLSCFAYDKAPNGYKGIRYLNFPMRYYFSTAYPEMNNIPFNCTIINVANSSLFDTSGKEIEGGKFCYEFISPIAIPMDTINQHYLKDDLYKTFHYKGHVENRKVTCYVIVDEGKKRDAVESVSEDKLALADLVNILNNTWKTPVINEVNSILYLKNIVGPTKVDNLPELQKNLEAAGYKLSVETRELPFFVITEDLPKS